MIGYVVDPDADCIPQIQSLLECKQEGSDDYRDILQLLQEIETAICNIQEEQAKHEEFQKLEDLEKRIMGLEVFSDAEMGCIMKQYAK